MTETFETLDAKALATPDVNEKFAIYELITKLAQEDATFKATMNMKVYRQREREFAALKDCGLATGEIKEDIRDKIRLRVGILGYKSNLVGEWDPETTEKGLPGSEECVVYGAEQLVKMGCRVTVYFNPPEESLWNSEFSNPRWRGEDKWGDEDNMERYDFVLLWRRFDVARAKQRTNTVFFWPHDSPPPLLPGQMYPPFPAFDGICILSEYHRGQFNAWPGFNKIPYAVCGNGYLPEHFTEPMSFTNPYSIGYFSNYSRGLIILLMIWPEVKVKFPQAELHICYGRETWNTMPPELLQIVITKIENYKRIGIIEHGKVGHKRLAHIMQHTSVFAYPCVCIGETFCITAVKCQAAGCIPVTTRIAALNETIHPDAPHCPPITNQSDIVQYKHLLLSTLSRIQSSDPTSIRSERQRYIDFARQFSWQNCVNKWLNFYQKVIS